MAQHNILGQQGEDMAVDFLKQKGYTVLERNYRYQKAEVDILARKDDVLAVVEVKTRSTNTFGDPQDFVKPRQIQNLVKAVDAFIADHTLDLEVRFDIIAIVKTKTGMELEHLENAFYHF
ncbi:YraN family protein [Formosa sp. S-31]|uniref:YraN family protein n=1 Tax=Formosa sp. S-31 TaxID=2790949 RepID=UPI003EBB7971